MTESYSRPDGKNRFQIASAAEEQLFSAWLDQEFNLIYGVLNGFNVSDVLSVSEWTNVQGTFSQDNSSSFTVNGDFTGVFEPLRAIRFTDDNSVTYDTHIQSSSYTSGTGTTTVTVYNPVIPNVITKVEVGLVSAESAAIQSTSVISKSANYTVGATDQVILADDSLPSSYTVVYDDGQVGGDGYPALLITLPVASSLPKKLLGIKKVAGTHKTIVSSAFVHSTSLNADNEVVHTNTYDFQILGKNTSVNRVELEGVGDFYWFVSDGDNWYELTPEASEKVKGIARFATEDEMTLTSQQIADSEELPKDLAVSPYNIDKQYMRTDASNMRFASNYIYTAPEGVPTFNNGNIEVYKGLGLNVADGRDDNNVCQSKRIELTANHTISDADVSENKHLLFVDTYGGNEVMTPILAKNYYIGYTTPTVTGTQTNDKIIWFDYGKNKLRLSTDNGTNWTDFDGAGPICEYSGNGASITYFQAYAPLAFLTREDLNAIRRVDVDWDGAVSISTSQMPYTFTSPGWYLCVLLASGYTAGNLYINSVKICAQTASGIQWADGASNFVKVKPGDVLTYDGSLSIGQSSFLPEIN